MKRIRIYLLMVLVIGLTSCNNTTNNDIKYKTYDSADALFSISVPDDYMLADTSSEIGISLRNKDGSGKIWILNYGNMLPEDFADFVYESINREYYMYNRDLITQTDSFVHCKISNDMVSFNRYYMRKDLMLNDYIIEVGGMSLSEKTARDILLSVKEYDLKGKQNKNYKKQGFTYYDKLGFAIAQEYNLQQNNLVIQMAEQQLGTADHILGAYSCISDENNPEELTMINVNVLNPDGDIDEYVLNLKNNFFDYRIKKWNNFDVVEYSFKQSMGGGISIPTKSMYFIHNNKSYLFQVASLSNVESKFQKLKELIIIL